MSNKQAKKGFRMPRVLRHTTIFASLSLTFVSFSGLAQQAQDIALEAQASDVNDTTASANKDRSQILRLEQTIRANKEQPQVLTIVPWQLPTHQRLNETKTWQPVVEALPSIERGQFLRDLAIVNQTISLSANSSDSNEDP